MLGEDFRHFGELLCFPGSLPWIHVTKLLFDFFPVNLSHLRTDSFEKTLMLGKVEGRRRRG